MAKYRIHLCIRRAFFLVFLSQSLLEFFKFKNAFKSREIDPKCRYFRHPVYGYVLVNFLLREVTVIQVYLKLAHFKNSVPHI